MSDERSPPGVTDEAELAGEEELADEAELRSAAALARALDGGPAEPGLPEAALGAAALLRLSAGAARLNPERSARIRQELLAALPSRARPRVSPWRFGLWLGLPLAGVAAAVSLLLVGAPELLPSAGAPRVASAPSAGAGDPRTIEPSSSPLGARIEQGPAAESLADERLADESLADERPPLERSVAANPVSASPVARSKAARSVAGESGFEQPAAQRAEQRFAGGEGGGTKGEMATAELGRLGRGQGLAARTRETSNRVALIGLERDARVSRGELLQRVSDPTLTRVHAERDAASGRAALEASQTAMSSTLGTVGAELSETDARLVRQDLYCRLAQTALELGQAQAALEWTRRGLALDGPATPFLAQLAALEGDALSELGDADGAAQSYLKALKIHETLLEENLDGR